MGSFEASARWLERAQRVIPLGTQTMSKTASQFVQGATPLYVDRGRGARVWDVDGNEYLDYPMALGPILLGHREPAVDEAIREQLDRGITFTLAHPLEVEVAERIVAMCPGVEAVRFAKSGSDAVSAAVRAARALTGRDHVVAGGYHGWHDWYVGSTTRAAGVPGTVQDLTATFRFSDPEHLAATLDERRGQVAAVVLEPSGAEVPGPGHLARIVEIAREHGALVVFDEVITGFRLAPGGARERYGVEPDLSCYGKALGNGMPISAVGGRWEVMRVFEEVFFSGTHGGETLSLAAARAVLDAIAHDGVLDAIERRGTRLRDGLADLVAKHDLGERLRISGEPQRAVVSFLGSAPLIDKSFVQQELAADGILFNGSLFVCYRHEADDIEQTLRAFDRILGEVADTDDLTERLQGPPVEPVFRAP